MSNKKRRYCSIRGCENYLGTDDPRIAVFNFPADTSLREKWLSVIHAHDPRAKYLYRICAAHFHPQDIITKTQNGKMVFTLKHGVIPTNFKPIFDPLEPIISIKTENDDEQLVDETVFAEPIPAKTIKFQERTFCVKCIQTDVQMQKLRDQITQLRKKIKAGPSSPKKQNPHPMKHKKCDVCQENLTIPELQSHLCSIKTLKCQYCPQRFGATIKLQEHLQSLHNNKRFYGCDRCPQQFAMIELLHMHSTIHSDNLKPTLTCDKCDKAFFMQSRLDEHIESQHSEPKTELIFKPFKCGECGKCFTTGRNLQCHMTSDHGKKRKSVEEYPFECYICRYQTQSLDDAQTHLRGHVEKNGGADDKRIDCEYCSMVFSSIPELSEHVLSSHPDRKAYKCLKCPRYFPTKSILDYHDFKHGNSEETHNCNMCSRVFYDEQQLKRHIQRHNMEKTHLCDECGKAFTTEKYLEAHKLTHSEPTIQCPDCPQRFRTKSHFVRHQNLHRNLKYVCHICNAELSSAPGLNSHLKKHKRTEADRRFACSQCPQKFFKNYTLQKHLKIVHSSIKQFQCTYCDSAYKHSGDLTKHLRTHLGDDLYHCPKCPKRFRAPIDLQKHSYEHYKEEKNMQESATSMDTT